jgi:integrase
VKDIGKSWLADQKRSCEHSTYRSYEGPVNRWIYPAIGSLRIRDVTVEHIRQMFRSLDVSLKTARNYSIPLAGIFVRAIDDEDIERNPMDRISIKTLIPKAKHDSDYEVDPLEEQDIFKLLTACREFRPGWFNYFVVALYTGMRTSELYGLRWDDVDWTEGMIRVHRAIVERQEKGPKTKSSKRHIEMSEVVVDALKHQRAATELVGAEIFRNPRTGKTLDDYEVSQRAFDYCCRKAGVRRRNQYQTRHSYASNMLMTGENPLFVAHQLGHKNVKMLFEVYAKYIPGHSMNRAGYGKRLKKGTA